VTALPVKTSPALKVANICQKGYNSPVARVAGGFSDV
jgi:hypothetical protein